MAHGLCDFFFPASGPEGICLSLLLIFALSLHLPLNDIYYVYAFLPVETACQLATVILKTRAFGRVSYIIYQVMALIRTLLGLGHGEWSEAS